MWSVYQYTCLQLDCQLEFCEPLVVRRHHLDPSGLQKAGQPRRIPLAPGQRLHLHRAAAISHLLDRADRRNGRERLPLGRARPAPLGHARPRSNPARLAMLVEPRRRHPRRSQSRRHRRLLPGRPTQERRRLRRHHRRYRSGVEARWRGQTRLRGDGSRLAGGGPGEPRGHAVGEVRDQNLDDGEGGAALGAAIFIEVVANIPNQSP